MTPLSYFQSPWLIVLAVVLGAAAALLVRAWAARRRARLARLGSAQVVARIAPGVGGVRSGWRATRLGLVALLGGLALADPRWGAEQTVVRGQGIDVVLALDASLSMLGTDERPDRLTRMKQEVRRLRAASPGDRMALVAFAGRSYILAPLTSDAGAIDLFLDNLDPSVVGQAGSSLARAIRQSADLLVSTKTGSDRAIVLMSDGEAFEPEEDVTAAARHAADAGVSLVTVGFGTQQGSTIPVREGSAVTEKRDEGGAIVVTRYSPDLLRAAATAAKGTFIAAEETDKAARVRQALSRLRSQARAVETGREQTPRFQLFLAPALALLLLDSWLAQRRLRTASSVTAAPRVATAALLLLATLGANGCRRPAAADPALELYGAQKYREAAAAYRTRIGSSGATTTPRALYNYGTALLAGDSVDASREPLDGAQRATEPEERFRALFNLGLAHLRRGLAMEGDSASAPLDAALLAYRKALLMRPADVDAKWNYELALRERQSGGGGGGGGGGNDQSPEQPDPAAPPAPSPQPAGGLGQQQAEQLLNSAARDERDIQGKKQRQNRPQPPPGGKDW